MNKLSRRSYPSDIKDRASKRSRPAEAQLNITMPAHLKREIAHAAGMKGVSMSEWAREALEKQLMLLY